MFVSIFDLFSIGIGPSSSHTVGPMKAAQSFAKLVRENVWEQTHSIQIELYGSLSDTGKGHGTDKAILLGLEGEHPETIEATQMESRVEQIYKNTTLRLLGEKTVPLKEGEQLIYKDEQKPFHSNAVVFKALDGNTQTLLEKTYYSIGGGFVVEDTQLNEKGELINTAEEREVPYPFLSAEKLLQYSKTQNCSIADIILENERVFRSDQEINEGLAKIWQAMKKCVSAGCSTEGVLPGNLKVKRRAVELYKKLIATKKIDQNSGMQWASLFALAVNEENAAGSNVVTAPTNGAAGIVPAVLHYFQKFYRDPSSEDLKKYFLTSAAIGSLYKNNASISGAEMGCQGEIGVACSMAAGGLTALQDGSAEQIENAAEIGMEHNLGLTCDPIMGLVQIPCIERNTMGTIKAINACLLALNQKDRGIVSLDKVIKTMKATGEDMKTQYKETSKGGLATNVIEC